VVRDVGNLILYDFVDQSEEVVGIECMFQSTKFIEYTPQGPYIALISVRLIFTHLGA
jgi:hypothetical protein